MIPLLLVLVAAGAGLMTIAAGMLYEEHRRLPERHTYGWVGIAAISATIACAFAAGTLL
jgi:hypothetical protein